MILLCNCGHQQTSTNIPLAEQMDMTDAARRLALELTIPQGKVCIGKISYEMESQKPLHDYFLHELELEVAGNMELVERKRIQELIQQQKFQTNDFFDQSNYKKIGQFASVDYLILATIQEHTTNYELTAKLVLIYTALVKKISRMHVSKEKIPPHVVREMARHELLAKGYKDLAEGQKGEIVSYFKSPQPIVYSMGSEPLTMKIQAYKKTPDGVQRLRDGEKLYKNDQYQFQLTVNQPAYVYAIHLAPNQQLTTLFTQEKPIPQDQLLHIPNKNEWLKVQDHQGVGQIGLLVTLQPQPELHDKLQKWDDNSTSDNIQEPCLIYSQHAVYRAQKSDDDVFPEEIGEIQIFSFNGQIIYPLWFQEN